MCKFLSFTALCLLSYCLLPTQATICWIHQSEDFHERMPLILKADSDEFFYPKKCGFKSLRITFKDRLNVACPDDTIHVHDSNTGLAQARLACYVHTFFGLVDTLHVARFHDIRCNHVPKAEVRTTTTTCGNGMISNVGFAVSNSSFVPTIEEVCRDDNQSYWTHHKVVPGLTKRSKPSHGDGGIFGDWGEWFGPSRTTTQHTTTTAGNQIINTLLVPREDMFYRAQQDSTSASINTVRMYESIRDGNWRIVEDIVRKIANKKSRCATLDVWTGRYNGPNSSTEAPTSTTTVPSTTASTEASTITTTVLSTSSTTVGLNSSTTVGMGRRSTPDFVFKMVVDKQRSRGIVFVTLNDPTAKVITPKEQLCTPYAECSQLYPQFNVISRGYTHCCTLNDFASVATELGIPTFPNYQPMT